jgi:hypothetical protein
MRLMLLAGSALGASPPQNLCLQRADTWGDGPRGQGHAGHPHTPRLETALFIKALSLNAPHFFIPGLKQKIFRVIFEDFRSLEQIAALASEWS